MIPSMRGARRRTGRTGVLLGLGLTAVLIGIVAIPACSNYSEGERCQVANGTDSDGSGDCQSGLVCTAAAQLTNTQSDRCCPADRTTATQTVCKLPLSASGTSSDAAASPDTGLTTGADAGTTSTSDAGDAGDASTDAPADG